MMLTRKSGAALVGSGRGASARSVVVRAQAQEPTSSRRQMLGFAGLAAGLLVGANQSAHAIGIELIDDKSKKLDYNNNIADQARDVDIDNNIRTGRTQARADKQFVVSRVAENKKRIENDVKGYIDSKAWYFATQELRRQLGNMSLDMNTLVAASSDKKQGAALKKDFFTAVDNMDFAIKKKDQAKALKYQEESVAKLGEFIAFAT